MIYHVVMEIGLGIRQSKHVYTTGWAAIFSSTLIYYRFSEEDWVSFGGRTLKYFVVRGAHSKIFCRGLKYFGTEFLRVYILEGRLPRGATMVGGERKNFETLKSLDRRKWHFQNLVWPSAGCRAQKGSWFRQCIMAISNSVTLLIIFWTLFKK